jgi:signal transduction histidine kinase
VIKKVENPDLALNGIAAVVSRSLDLEEILGSALKAVLDSTGADAGGIYLLNDKLQKINLAAQLGFGPELHRAIHELDAGEGFSGQVIESGKPITIQDLSRDPRLTRSAVREADLKSLLVVPLCVKEKALGTIFLVSRQLREFTNAEIELLLTAGHQIGMAVENARLFQEERRRAEQFRVIAEVSRKITSILNIDQILDQVVHLIQEAFQYDHVGIATIEGDYAVYQVGAGPIWDNPDYKFKPARLKIGSEGLTGHAAKTGEAIYSPDVRKDPRFINMEDSGTLSELTVPITAKGKIIGVLDAQSQHLNAFDESDQVMLQSLADQAAVAIENARLYEQARQFAVIEERSRIARELHDSVTQALYGITLHAEAASRQLQADNLHQTRKQLEELRLTAQEALREMRLLIFELRPSILKNQGLVSALRARVEAVEQRAGIQVDFQVSGEIQLDHRQQNGLYRIAQEALNNALKHARADRILVHLTARAQTTILEIGDDGIGFNPETAVPGGGLGLDGIIERVEELGGKLDLESAPGQGTMIRVEVTHA